LGTLALLFVSAVTALFVYKAASSARTTLRINKTSKDLESFFKACASVDEDSTFARSYALVLRNAPALEHAVLSRDGELLLGADDCDSALPRAAADVLATLERVATISHYATSGYTANDRFIDERTAEIVIRAHEALSSIVAELQQDDPKMYEHFDMMYTYCKSHSIAQAV